MLACRSEAADHAWLRLQCQGQLGKYSVPASHAGLQLPQDAEPSSAAAPHFFACRMRYLWQMTVLTFAC